jgi:hypothetical protein
MRFYNIDMKGKFFAQRASSNPAGTGAGDEGRMFYNETSEEMYYHDAAAWIKIWSENNDGPGSGLNADLLDGQEGTYYLDAGNLTGTISDARMGGPYSIDITGTATTAKWA